jgi:hypothetical protein
VFSALAYAIRGASHLAGWPDTRLEGVKKLIKGQNNSRKDAKTQRSAKQTKDFFSAFLCVLASWRETVYFFTAHHGVCHLGPLARESP